MTQDKGASGKLRRVARSGTMDCLAELSGWHWNGRRWVPVTPRQSDCLNETIGTFGALKASYRELIRKGLARLVVANVTITRAGVEEWNRLWPDNPCRAETILEPGRKRQSRSNSPMEVAMAEPDLAEEPWQVFRRLCTPATTWHDQAGWQNRADAFIAALRSPSPTDRMGEELADRLRDELAQHPINGSFANGSLADYSSGIVAAIERVAILTALRDKGVGKR